MEKVAAVVVTYNRKKLLSENIGALLKQSYKDCVIIIVDNNSSDVTYELLKSLIDQGKIKYYNTIVQNSINASSKILRLDYFKNRDFPIKYKN